MAASHLTRKMDASEELAAFTGKSKIARSEAVKAVWDYAKENGLNETRSVNKKNCAGILPDSELAIIFGSKKWHGMGDIARAISAHLS